MRAIGPVVTAGAGLVVAVGRVFVFCCFRRCAGAGWVAVGCGATGAVGKLALQRSYQIAILTIKYMRSGDK